MRFIGLATWPPNRNALAVQDIARHPAARERVVEMQLVDPAHDLQVRARDRLRLVADSAPADAERRGLPRNGQVVVAVDHRLALSKPALVSAACKKSLSSVSSPSLA
jgi:predicted TIM-barrel fold metal-dependent hydrolase